MLLGEFGAYRFSDPAKHGGHERVEDFEVNRANARLAIAAPELLGALVMARALLVDVEGYEVDGASVSVIDAAIAKATGAA